MSDTNVTQQVASGESPQPNADAGQETNLDAEMVADDVVGDSDEASSEEAAIDAAQADGTITKKEAQNLKKRLKLKVDGQEEDVEIDLGDEQALIRELQKSRAFDKRSKEFSGYKNQVDQFFKQLKEMPESVLEQLGINVDDMTEKRMARRIEEMQKSPEQLEREKMQKELEELKAEKKRAEEERSKAEMESLRNKYASEIENEIETEIGNSKSKLPQKNPRVIARIAQTMLWATQNGYPDVKVKDVIPYVEKEWREELRSYFDTSAEDMIEELVGKQNLDRMRKKRLANRPKAQTAATKSIQDTGKKTEPVEDDNKPKKKMRDIFSLID